MAERTYDVVLYGATGFTGRQTAHYFAASGDAAKLRWAIAGRNRDKLEALRRELGTAGEDIGVVVADSEDGRSVGRMVRSTRVVLNTAGPFALYGEPVVASCVRNGADYVDITGETPYVRELVDRYHDEAAAAGVKIVPCCGFDSVPSDLGTLLVVDHVRRELGQPCVEVKALFAARGGVNGGTLASVFHMQREGQREQVADPFLLNPEGTRPDDADEPRHADPWAPYWDDDAQAWAAPFLMGPVNTRVVRRSHALASQCGEGYGPEFAYQEYLEVGRGPLAWAQASAITVATASFLTLTEYWPTRDVLEAVLPKPGSGPSERTMDDGFFRCRVFGTTPDGDEVRAVLASGGDPGNRVTVKILCEAALALASQRDALPGGAERGGILTPATGLGLVLAERLRAAGMTIRVERG